jgi:hypothetical protein
MASRYGRPRQRTQPRPRLPARSERHLPGISATPLADVDEVHTSSHDAHHRLTWARRLDGRDLHEFQHFGTALFFHSNGFHNMFLFYLACRRRVRSSPLISLARQNPQDVGAIFCKIEVLAVWREGPLPFSGPALRSSRKYRPRRQVPAPEWRKCAPA